MLRSMTGFGSAAREAPEFSVRVEVRSVNHRFLQVKSRLPSDHAGLESRVEALARKKLDRGAVHVAVNLIRSAGTSSLQMNNDVAARYVELVESLAAELGYEERRPSLDTLISLPGVVADSDDTRSIERESKAILAAVSEALVGLVSMRESEGANIEKDLRKHAAAIAKAAKQIGTRMPKVVKEHHENLLGRVEELLGGRRVLEPADLTRELALLADKLDVSEELDRLRSHLEQLDKLLGKKQAVGRQIDFLVQEFLREANTIGSKCNDAKVAHMVVELKTHIERLREQTQNAE